MKLILLWGVIDAFLLATKPTAWGKFWQVGVSKISGDDKVARGFAGLQLGFCIWLWRKLEI